MKKLISLVLSISLATSSVFASESSLTELSRLERQLKQEFDSIQAELEVAGFVVRDSKENNDYFYRCNF